MSRTVLHCARRGSTFLLCGLRGQEGWSVSSPLTFLDRAFWKQRTDIAVSPSTLFASSPRPIQIEIGSSEGVVHCACRTIHMFRPSLLVVSLGWGLIDLPLRASNEGFLKPRVAPAQEIIRPHPLPCSMSKKDASLLPIFLSLLPLPASFGRFYSPSPSKSEQYYPCV